MRNSTKKMATNDSSISNDGIGIDGVASGNDDKIVDTNVHKVKRNINPVPMWDSACLIFSSSFFLIPAYYAYLQNIDLAYFCMVVSILTSLVSMNYWRHSTSEGLSLKLDYLFSRGSFLIYLSSGTYSPTHSYSLTHSRTHSGVCYVRNINLIIIGWIQAFLIIFFYKLSCYLWDKDSPYWVYAHMCFHLVGSLNKALVVLGSFDNLRANEVTSLFFK